MLVSALLACGGAEDRKAKYFERGKSLFEQGNYVKAELEFKNVLQIDPKDIEALYMLGRVAEKQQEWRDAFGAYSGVLELDPDHVPALVARGHLYRLSGSSDKALEAAETALMLAPGNADALVLRGATRTQLGMMDEGMRDARTALQKEPDNDKAISLVAMHAARKGEMDEAIALLEAGIVQHPDNAGMRLLLAGFYDRAGNQAKTVEMLESVISKYPDDLKFRLQLSAYYIRHDNLDAAEQVLRDAVDVDPENEQYKLALADFLAKKRDPSVAEKELLGFIEQNPKAYTLRFGLAELYKATDKSGQAKLVYEEVIAADDLGPSGLSARNKLAEILFAEGELVEAGELAAEVLKENPKDTAALIIRARIALVNKDPDQAIADSRTVLGGIPNDPTASLLLAQAHLQRNEVTLAREALEKSVEANPRDITLNLDLAKVLVATGDAKRALAVLEKLVQAVPDNYTALHALGNLQIAQKQWDALKNTAQVLKSKKPEHPLGYYYMGVALRGQKAYADSVVEFEQALNRKPDAIQTLMEMSKSYLALEQPEKALAHLDKAVESNPNNLTARGLTGEIYLLQKRYDEAETVFKELIRRNPKWSTPYRNLFNLHIVRGETEKAMAVLQEGIGATDDNSLRFLLAGVYERKGDPAQAMRQYEAILAKAPLSVLAANNLAMLLVEDNPDQAALDKAFDLVKGFSKAKNPIFLDTLGWVHYQRGEYKDALSILEKASDGAAELPVIDYHLGLAYAKLGQKEKARESLGRALNSGVAFRESADAKQALDTL